MGTSISKETRRISFDNSIELNSSLNIQKSIPDDDILDIGNMEMKPSNESNKDNFKYVGLHEDEQDYWAQRIEHLKNEHQLINKIIESEYEKTIENTKKLFVSPKITQEKIKKIKPCFEWRHKILQCYEDNPHQPLVCSSIVQEFSSCVSACGVEEKKKIELEI